MSKQAIVERVRRLIALSASDNEHEARNAASAACRLIREHGLGLVAGQDAAPSVHHHVDLSGADFTEFMSDIFGDHFRGAKQREWERVQLSKQAEQQLERERQERAKRNEQWEAMDREAERRGMRTPKGRR